MLFIGLIYAFLDFGSQNAMHFQVIVYKQSVQGKRQFHLQGVIPTALLSEFCTVMSLVLCPSTEVPLSWSAPNHLIKATAPALVTLMVNSLCTHKEF